MIRSDTGLRFWLHYVECSDGLWEDVGDGVVAVLPPRLAAELALPEEVQVTGDPDVAREDGVTFLGTGHPAVTMAAEAVLAAGDVGVVTLARPRSLPPSAATLQAKARERLSVEHGRIDVVGEPRRATRGVLRASAVVSYAVSTEDRFQERVECWVDLTSGLAVPDRVSARLAGTEVVVEAGEACWPAEIDAGVARAHQLLEEAAVHRRRVLASQATREYDTERRRAEEYYDAFLTSLENRRSAAPTDRQALLEARAASTREERARRLAEIAEKFQARHEIRPYRLHLVRVPVLRLSADVLRGERRFPIVLDWLLPVGDFADVRCPTCGGQARLVASKTGLGCALCLPTKPALAPGGLPGTAGPLRHGAAAESGPPGGDLRRYAAQGMGGEAAPARAPAQPIGRQLGQPQPAHIRPARPAPRPAARVPLQTRPGVTTANGPAAAADSGQQSGQIGRRLAVAFWEAAAAGQSRTLKRLCDPTSPAAALLRLWGATGPLRAVGITGSAWAESITTAYTAGSGGVRETCGEVVTRAARNPYLLRWRADGGARLVIEVLPSVGLGPARWPASGWLEHPQQSWFFGAGWDTPPGLDPVARALHDSTLPRRGLPILLRSLAAWWRVADSSALLDQHSSGVVAAAVERAACYWSGVSGGTFREVASAHAVEEAQVRAVAAALQRLLRTSREHPW